MRLAERTEHSAKPRRFSKFDNPDLSGNTAFHLSDPEIFALYENAYRTARTSRPKVSLLTRQQVNPHLSKLGS